MDPFSITVGTIGLLDICTRVISFLTHIREESHTIQEEIITLSQEIESLATVIDSVKNLYDRQPDLGNLPPDNSVDKDWQKLCKLLQRCRSAVLGLERLLREVVGKKGTRVVGKIDGLVKTTRLEGRDEEYLALRQRLGNYLAWYSSDVDHTEHVRLCIYL